ncbi:MAG: hypothetical protein ABIM98_06930 [candidate division WOR-3 bacterium]
MIYPINERFWELDEEVREILRCLERYENTIFEDREKMDKILQKGEKIVEKLIEREEFVRIEKTYTPSYPYSPSKGGSFNVIPSGLPGSCKRVLVVIIGSKDSVKMRILEAIEHISVKCLNITKYVIFWAVKWDTSVWNKHRYSFEKLNIKVVLKQFYLSPIKVL